MISGFENLMFNAVAHQLPYTDQGNHKAPVTLSLSIDNYHRESPRTVTELKPCVFNLPTF